MIPTYENLWSFGVQGALLRTFGDSVVATAISFGVVCWSSSITAADRKWLNILIRRASSVLGFPAPDPVEVVGDRRTHPTPITVHLHHWAAPSSIGWDPRGVWRRGTAGHSLLQQSDSTISTALTETHILGFSVFCTTVVFALCCCKTLPISSLWD